MLPRSRHNPSPSQQEFDSVQALRMVVFFGVLTVLIGGGLTLLLPDFGIQWLLWLVGFVVAAGIVSSDEPPVTVGAIVGLGVLGALLFYRQPIVQIFLPLEGDPLGGPALILATGVALALALGVAFLVYRVLCALGLDFHDAPTH